MAFRFVPTPRVIENFKKIAKNFKKLKNTIMVTFHAEIVCNSPRKRKKKIVPISSYQTRNRKFQKNSKKIKKLKNQILA